MWNGKSGADVTVWLSLSEVSLNKKKKKTNITEIMFKAPSNPWQPFQVVAHVVIYFYLKKSLVIIRKIEQFGFTIVSNMQTKWQIV